MSRVSMTGAAIPAKTERPRDLIAAAAAVRPTLDPSRFRLFSKETKLSRARAPSTARILA